jgi:uncharacterized protein
MLAMIKQELTGKQALNALAKQIQHPQPQVIIEFGVEILDDLMMQQAIIGSAI